MSKEQPPRIPDEVFTIRLRAQQLFSFWQVARRLNLNDADWDLAMSYTTERLTRTGVYETSSFLNSSIATVMAKFGFSKRTLIAAERLDKTRRAALEYQQYEIESLIEDNYKSPEEKQRARTIELAINALVAEATPPPPAEKLIDKMSLTNDQLNAWTTRWRPQLTGDIIQAGE